jgi:hypothetical protein
MTGSSSPGERSRRLIVARERRRIVVFPLLGLQAIGQNVRLALVFAVLNVGRSFLLRRRLAPVNARST